MRVIALFIALTLSEASIGCTVSPESMWDSNYELVESTPHIALAKVVEVHRKKTPGFHGTFKFETVEPLKGDPPRSFTRQGYLYDETEGAPGDFDGHRAPAFWAYDAGNSVQPGDCSAYGIYHLGGQFLIFFREESHPRAFEEIDTKDDLWFHVVKLLAEDER